MADRRSYRQFCGLARALDVVGERWTLLLVRELLLGPLAVDPDTKSKGTGSLLMRHALSEAARLGHGAVLLVGDAPYYARFGFTAEKTAALALPGPVERDRFLAIELAEGWLDGAAGMVVATGEKVTKPRKLRLVA